MKVLNIPFTKLIKTIFTMPPAILFYCCLAHVVIFFISPQKISYLAIVLSVIFVMLFLIFSLGALKHFILSKINPSPWYENDKILFCDGIYRMSRNPMYLSLLFLLIAQGVIFTPLLLTVTPFIFIKLINIQIKREEAFLLKNFSKSYKQYMQSTPKWLFINKIK